MANSLLLPLTLTFLFLFHSCLAQLELPQQQFWQNSQTQQQHRLRAKTQCRIQQLNAREPNRRFQFEAGTTEIWDSNTEEFECAGVQFVRHTIQPKGLFLPYYSNAPQLVYVVQGSGIQGTVFPGCAETYESESSSSYEGREEGGSRRGEGSSRSDKHQKLRRFRQGDILALPQGITHWCYNDGDTDIVTVSLFDVANENNQLDLNYRKFNLAGQTSQSQQQGERQREQGSRRGEQEQEQQQQQQQHRNIFYGFDAEILSQAFNINPEIIRNMQVSEDNRGSIVRAEQLHLMLPEFSRQEEQEREREQYHGGRSERGYNGLEETFCTLKIRENIDHPTRSDVYNPRGGRITSLNSQKLPILSYLRLSAERGVLYKNALLAPHWNTNCHCAMYVTRGSARVQIVGHNGQTVFDGEVKEGQLLILPQNFVILKKASNEGFEWVGFKTNDNAIRSQLAGRLSAIRAMPEDVLVNSYGISREDARNLKYNREEATVFSASSRSERRE